MELSPQVSSHQALEELDAKLRGKFQMSASDAELVQRKIEEIALVVTPKIRFNAVPDDPDDNRVLECAVEACADFMVSGDRHLRKLRLFQDIEIVTVRQFLDLTAAAISDLPLSPTLQA